MLRAHPRHYGLRQSIAYVGELCSFLAALGCHRRSEQRAVMLVIMRGTKPCKCTHRIGTLLGF